MKIFDKPIIKQYTTLEIGGIAQREYLLEDVDDIEKIAHILSSEKLPHILLGGGSNVLIEDGELDCILVRDEINAKKAVEIVKEDSENVWLGISSGMYLPVFIHYCVKHGFSGLEGLVGIPGRMGGALAMNAGAYGCEIAQVFESAQIFTPENGLITYTNSDVSFGYRRFELEHTYSYAIHADMCFKMKKFTSEQVQATVKENFEKKKKTQPLGLKTAGCAFKNPEGKSAGKLLDDVGLKGYAQNGVSFSAVHANFLTNHAHGSFEDALKLIRLAKEKVYENFSTELHTEIKVIHFSHTEELL